MDVSGVPLVLFILFGPVLLWAMVILLIACFGSVWGGK